MPENATSAEDFKGTFAALSVARFLGSRDNFGRREDCVLDHLLDDFAGKWTEFKLAAFRLLQKPRVMHRFQKRFPQRRCPIRRDARRSHERPPKLVAGCEKPQHI